MAQLFVIGIDGGGTRTSAVLCDEHGNVLTTVHGGPANVNTSGLEQTAHTLAQLINQCCLSVRCSISEIGAVVAGLAGGGETSVQQAVPDAINRYFGEEIPLYIENDARIALESAFDGKAGLLTVVGTGSVVYGKKQDGSFFCLGGWGRLLGDEGSGWWLGREVLRAVLASYDGTGKETLCTDLVAAQHNWTTRYHIIEAVYRQHFDVASLAPLVLQAAEQNDAVASKIIKEGSRAILQLLKAAIRQLHWKSAVKIPLVFEGSLVTRKNIYKKLIRYEIQNAHLPVRIVKPKRSPAVGAARIALALMKNRPTIFTKKK